MSTGDGGARSSDHHSHYAGDGTEELTEEKFNEDTAYEMRIQREKIKKAQKEYEIKQMEEARKNEANKRRR
jgi:hypothetical protein